MNFKSLFVAAMAACALSASAQTSPKDVLKDIESFRSQQISDARKSGKELDFEAIQKAVKAKAADAVKGLDPKTIDAKDALDWAKVYSIAEDHKDVCDLTHKFLTTNPDAETTFQTKILMMESCNAMGEGKMLDETLKSVQPVSLSDSTELAQSTVYEFADTIAKTEGPKEAIKTLDKVAEVVKYEDPKTKAASNLETEKKRLAAMPSAAPSTDDQILAKLAARYQTQNDSIKMMFVEEKANLLTKEGKKKNAVAEIDSFVKTLAPDSPVVRSATYLKTRISLNGATPPEMIFDHQYGDFKSLADWKGKVIVLDTFAHWCGPCKASFPSMRKMYDDLHTQGLEIVGVTNYYGFIGKEQKLSKEDEFAKMDAFRTEHNMNWPIIFGDKSNFEKLGITGIPTTYIIGRDGKVVAIHVGYDDQDFAALRAEVEKALKAG